ncbi:MAG TPA: GNAT family N-acetyltransferase [Blastocatellia bacterium]|nr:GNAT family N-acetyltransferase [Blastocatellia bacterium]
MATDGVERTEPRSGESLNSVTNTSCTMQPEDKQIEVTRTYLQLESPGDFSASAVSDVATVARAVHCPASFYRYLYQEVGRNYHWIDRLVWTDDDIRRHLERTNIGLWVMYHSGAPGGYFELEQHPDGSTEIAYLGLLQDFIGQGLGKYLLSQAVEQARASRPIRIWLHTCSLDGPAAMPNYLKHGFKPFKQETYYTTLAPWERRDLGTS